MPKVHLAWSLMHTIAEMQQAPYSCDGHGYPSKKKLRTALVFSTMVLCLIDHGVSFYPLFTFSSQSLSTHFSSRWSAMDIPITHPIIVLHSSYQKQLIHGLIYHTYADHLLHPMPLPTCRYYDEDQRKAKLQPTLPSEWWFLSCPTPFCLFNIFPSRVYIWQPPFALPATTN